MIKSISIPSALFNYKKSNRSCCQKWKGFPSRTPRSVIVRSRTLRKWTFRVGKDWQRIGSKFELQHKWFSFIVSVARYQPRTNYSEKVFRIKESRNQFCSKKIWTKESRNRLSTRWRKPRNSVKPYTRNTKTFLFFVSKQWTKKHMSLFSFS